MIRPQQPDSSTQAIMRLVNSFPCLRAKLRTAPTGYFDGGFNSQLFLAALRAEGKTSPLETECARFVVCAWESPCEFQADVFDLFKFMLVSDAAHRRVISEWILDPVWLNR